MKTNLITAFLMILSYLSPLYSQQSSPRLLNQPAKLKVMGGGNYGADPLESLEVSGLVKLHGTTIHDVLEVTGSVIALYANLNHIKISGEANLTDTIVKNEGTITGSIQAFRSTFHQKLMLLTQKAVFTNCKIHSLSIRQDSAFKGKQVLELKQGTIVEGPIVFDSGKGEILLYSGSKILGSVTGAKVIRK